MIEPYCPVSPLHPAGYDPCPVCEQLETLRTRVSELEAENARHVKHAELLARELRVTHSELAESQENEKKVRESLSHLINFAASCPISTGKLEAELTASRANEARLLEALKSLDSEACSSNIFDHDGWNLCAPFLEIPQPTRDMVREALSSTASSVEWLENIRREAKREELGRCVDIVHDRGSQLHDNKFDAYASGVLMALEDEIRALGDET